MKCNQSPHDKFLYYKIFSTFTSNNNSLVAALVIGSTSDTNGQLEYPHSSFGIRAGGNVNSWTNEYPALEYGGTLVYPDD